VPVEGSSTDDVRSDMVVSTSGQVDVADFREGAASLLKNLEDLEVTSARCLDDERRLAVLFATFGIS